MWGYVAVDEWKEWEEKKKNEIISSVTTSSVDKKSENVKECVASSRCIDLQGLYVQFDLCMTLIWHRLAVGSGLIKFQAARHSCSVLY